jgi:hypothetical protein
LGDKQKRTSKSYRPLIQMVAKSSGYHVYEVEDVLQHLVGNIQAVLAADMPVKISGLGTMRVKKMKIKGIPGKHAENTCYTAFRLSVTSDTGLQNHLKEHHVESTDPFNY